MKALNLFCFFVCISLLSQSQVQFWNLADVEDEQWFPARKQASISRLSIFQTDENGKRLDSLQPNEVREFDRNGRLIAASRYKYSYQSRQWGLLQADSFYYNATGICTGYKGFEGPYRNLVYETQITVNTKNQATRQDHYTFSGGLKTLDRYDVFEYDAKGLAKKMTSYDDQKKPTGTRIFLFNAGGKLIKSVSTSTGSSITTLFNRGKNNELISFQEFYDKELQKTITYTYDANGRRSRTQTQSPGYDDFTEFRYPGDGGLPVQTYLQYSGLGGKNDRRHEYRELVYQ